MQEVYIAGLIAFAIGFLLGYWYRNMLVMALTDLGAIAIVAVGTFRQWLDFVTTIQYLIAVFGGVQGGYFIGMLVRAHFNR